MKDTRLLRLIKTFTKEELKSFEKFLQSPFLKPARDTSELYYYIIKFHPDYDTSKLDKEKVFEKLFKGESYNEKKLLNLIFDLTKAAEDFLTLNTIMEDETELLLNLSKGYMKKNLSEESNRVNKLIEKKLQPGFSLSKNYFTKFRELNHLKGNYFTQINDFDNLIECRKEHFENSTVQFIVDYTEIKSSNEFAKRTYGRTMENYFIECIYKCFDLEKLLKLLEKSDYKNKSIVEIQYYILKLKQEPEKYDYYFLLKALFYKTLAGLDREEKCYVFSYLINYCVQQFSNTTVSFKQEALEVSKKMFECNAYTISENEYIQVMTFRNTVYFCITLKDAEWLEYFISKYSSVLSPDVREDIKNFSYGLLYFMKKEYEVALKKCSMINKEFFIFKADLKNLMLKIYFELNYIEPAFSMVDSYKHYLSKNKEITNDFKTDFTNFLNFYLDLLKIKSMQSKESASFIRKKISKETKIVNKGWLLEKADELNNEQ